MAPPSRCSSNVWTIDHERLLIEFFEEHRFLWHLKDPDHMNRVMRNTALQQCILLLGNNDVNGKAFTIESLKGKFTNLRTTFQREMKRVDAADRLGIVHVPKWNLFTKLFFLKEALRGHGGQSDTMDNRNSHSPKDNNEYEITDNVPECNLRTPDAPQQLVSTSRPTPRSHPVSRSRQRAAAAPPRFQQRRSIKRSRRLGELFDLLERASCAATEDTPEEVFGQHVATSLKAMLNVASREKAKLEIQKIIYLHMFDSD